MSVEEFRAVVVIGLLWIIFNIKTAKGDIVRAIKELKQEVPDD